MPGPVSSTATRTRLSSVTAERRTLPPSGVWKTAFSIRLPVTCAMRAASALTNGRSGAVSSVRSTPFAWARGPNDSAAARSIGSSCMRCRSSRSEPASARASTRRSSTRWERSDAWSAIVSIVSGVGSTSPSFTASKYPRMFERGVLSSCATSAIMLRRCCSARSNASAIVLKLRPSSPISSCPGEGTRWLRSPRPSRLAALRSLCTGPRILPETSVISAIPPTAPTIPV